MKTLKRGVKRGVRVFLPKFFNLFVILGLIIQPVGPAGLYSLALSAESDPAAVSSDAVAPTPEPVKEEVVVPVVEEKIVPVDTTSAPTTSTTDTSSVSDTPVEPSAPTPSIGDTGATTDISSNVENTTTPPIIEEGVPAVTNPEMPALTEEITPTETPAETPADTAVTPAVSTETPASANTPTETTSIAPVQEAAVTPAVPADETVCLSASVTGDSEGNWTINEAKNTAVTNGAVELGVRYVYPLDKEVTVTFTCLPSDESKRAPLKIERIDASDLRLPNGVSILSDYAYDLTTEGMENGTFKYDLTLPKFENAKANISYIEKSADEVIGKKLTANDVKQVNKENVDNNTNTIEASGIDHFTIVFVSGSTLCQNDVNGANDLSGQKDLTRMCSDASSLPTTLRVKWNWDDTAWSGGNTGDACGLFDTDNDGKANYSLCVTVGGNPATYISKTLYSCNDNNSDKCAGNSVISTSADTICEATIDGLDPFSAGNNFPNDTIGACSIKMSDISASSAKLIDVCSYPSAVPNSSPSDCIIATAQDTGKLEVKKVLSPSNDAGLFDLSVDGSILVTGVGNNGTTGEQVVLSANSHTFNESGNGTTNLSNYTTTVSCKDNNGAGSTIATTGSFPWTITVAKDKDIVCTITNTRVNNGSITIIKDAQPDSDQDFAFTGNIPNAQSFSLDDDVDGTLSNTKLVSNLAAGTYSVSEAAVPGWTQTSTTCTNGSPVSAISLQAGENVTCTFTNSKSPKLTLEKTVINNNGGTAIDTNWTLSASGSTPISGVEGNAAVTNALVNPGTYNLSESGGPSGYSPSQYSCVKNGGGAVAGNSITLAYGDVATCTITNDDQQAYIIVDKTVVNDNGWNATPDSFNLTVDGGVALDGVAVPVNPGVHTVGETLSPGYTAGAWGGNCNVNASVTVALGETKTCTITNDDIAPKLHLRKVIVNDNGGTATAAAFTLTADGTGANDLSGTSPVDSGTGLLADTFALSETPLAGYTASAWVCVGGKQTDSNIKIDAGGEATCTITNDDTAGTLIVHKVTDPDSDTTTKFSITAAGGTVNGDATQPIFGGNSVEYSVDQGTYSVSEANLTGWDETGNTCSNIEIKVGETKECTITNTKQGHIIVDKVTDPSGDEEQVFDFATIGEGYDGFSLTDTQDPNDQGLAPGPYSIAETTPLPDGWDLSRASCTSSLTQGDPIDPNDITLNPGEIITCVFNNHFTPPVLQISKTNDSSSPETPGNDVIYTITVTAPDSNITNVEDVEVTDLPPAGFEFISGTETATQGSLTHTYASPGVWSLGTMTPGQVITLSYRTIINGSQDAGTYEDLAFARGNSVVNDTDTPDVTANASESTPFVGTDVEVILPVAPADVALTNIVERNVDTKTIHKTKRVLGAATILPSTGANVNTILLALMLLLSGLILMLLGKRSTWNLIKLFSKSMSKAVKIALFIILGILLVGHSASAASGDLNVKIEQPKAVINSPEIKVGFVVLDISAGDPIDVECEVAYEAGPFGEFDTYTIAAGGTSGNCDVDAADMPADGTYTFRVTAEEQEGGDSDIATAAPIELVSGTPSTPLNYFRAAGSCTASFTTANDGLTDKVELYRSLSSTFTANGSTLVATSVSIGPNVAGTVIDTNSDCGGSYFYAIRAIAASGLGSGFVGDESVTIDNEHKVKTKTTTKKVAGPTTTLGAIPVTGGEVAPTGAVEGAATSEEVQPSAEQEKAGSVLGSATEAAGAVAGGLVDWIKSHPWWSALWLGIIVLIAYFARRMYFGNYNENNQPR